MTITVLPFDMADAIIIFSVAPTLGKGSIILVPITKSAQALMDEPLTLTFAPKSLSAFKCRSIGLVPISQPPG